MQTNFYLLRGLDNLCSTVPYMGYTWLPGVVFSLFPTRQEDLLSQYKVVTSLSGICMYYGDHLMFIFTLDPDIK